VLNNRNFFLVAFTWTIAITILSLISVNTINNPIQIPYKDKIVHFIFYYFFVLFWSLWLSTSQISKPIWTILVIGIFFGIAIEFCQGYFTSNRSMELLDIVANSVGAFFGFITATKCIEIIKSRF
jgi:VanZ family protein